ncbi:hypothetical protein PAXRUDRAFT_834406 [Paxillus rubicundulus Ve08.2h10]|uniref:Uncharacterized protein n=1 Tax=Paxillus rubicundulus Ve08.2h10 TaxID=930991 RepID=A0A0D0C771_9AGAM|nr:hypothetical protein PAXRUDRAFT_834406 [Paxillus rubicundulus Ve08.2h10]
MPHRAKPQPRHRASTDSLLEDQANHSTTEPTAISLCCPGFWHHLVRRHVHNFTRPPTKGHGNQSSSTPSPNYCTLHPFLNPPTLTSHHSSYGPTAQSPLHVSTLTHPTCARSLERMGSFYAQSTSYDYSRRHASAPEPRRNSQTSLNESYFGPPGQAGSPTSPIISKLLLRPHHSIQALTLIIERDA